MVRKSVNKIIENTNNYQKLNVMLKEVPDKGVGVFARKNIKANKKKIKRNNNKSEIKNKIF